MVSIQQSGGTIDFKRDSSDGQIKYSSNGGTWNEASFPVTIVNTPNASLINILTVRITMDITFYNWDGTNQFICGSEYITFDGMNNTCTLNGFNNYEGFIKNNNGYSNITVKNIKTTVSNGSILANGSGWVCCSNFGQGATNTLITNCSSSGEIGYDSGGICGSNVGANGGSVTITNCSSYGNISGEYSGGICGFNAGINNGSVTITNCSSYGNISGAYSGGICGAYACNGGLLVTITNCYSRGYIGSLGSGGICGGEAGVYNGEVHVTNCYSSGTITNEIYGIFGINPWQNATSSNCYVANGTWTSSVANTNLTGTPVSPSNVGTVWAYDNNDSSIPYILSSFYLTITNVVSGTVANTIDINGLNFNMVTSVFINGDITSVPFTISSNTLINADVSTYIEIVSVTLANASTSVTYQVSPICFIAGTPVQTDQGIICIENINPKIHTIHNKRIVAITRTITNEKTLVCIEPDALAPNVPSEKTTVSRCHAILFNGKMVRAKKIVSLISDKDKVYPVKYNGEILYNVLLEFHERMSVNNMTVETLDPNHMIAKLYLGNNECKIGQKMIA